MEEKKTEEREARLNGFESCVTDYIAKYAKPKQRTWKETERILKKYAVKEWGERPVKELRRRDVVDLLDSVATRTPYQANQLRAHLSRLFNWLIEREVVELSPITGVAPRVKVQARDRVLSDEEIVACGKRRDGWAGRSGQRCESSS